MRVSALHTILAVGGVGGCVPAGAVQQVDLDSTALA